MTGEIPIPKSAEELARILEIPDEYTQAKSLPYQVAELYVNGDYEKAASVWREYTAIVLKYEYNDSIKLQTKGWLKFFEGTLERTNAGEPAIKYFEVYRNGETEKISFDILLGQPFWNHWDPVNSRCGNRFGEVQSFIAELNKIKGDTLSISSIMSLADTQLREKLLYLLRAAPYEVFLDYKPDYSDERMPKELNITVDSNLKDNYRDQVQDAVERARKFVDAKLGLKNHKPFTLAITTIPGKRARSHADLDNQTIIIDTESDIRNGLLVHETTHEGTPVLCTLEGYYIYLCEGLASYVEHQYENENVPFAQFGRMTPAIGKRKKVGDFHRANDDSIKEEVRESEDYQFGLDFWTMIERKFGTDVLKAIVADIENLNANLTPDELKPLADEIILKHTGKTTMALLEEANISIEELRHGMFSNIGITFASDIGFQNYLTSIDLSFFALPTPVEKYLRHGLNMVYGQSRNGSSYNSTQTLGFGYYLETLPIYPLKWPTQFYALQPQLTAGVNWDIKDPANKNRFDFTPYIQFTIKALGIKFSVFDLSAGATVFANLNGIELPMFFGRLGFSY